MLLGQYLHLDKNDAWTKMTLGQCSLGHLWHLDNNVTWTIMWIGQCSLEQLGCDKFYLDKNLLGQS